jgi:hypothetical protein
MGNYFHYGHHYQNSDFYYFDNDEGYFRGDFGEFGIGYFSAFEGDYVFEAYGGMGWGGVYNETGNDLVTLKSKVNYNRYFIQPAVGWAGKHINLAISFRYSLLDYTKFTAENYQTPIDINDLVNLNHNPSFLFEPALTFRAGGENIKFQSQFGYSVNIGNPDAIDDPLNISLGLIFTIHGDNTLKEDKTTR